MLNYSYTRSTKSRSITSNRVLALVLTACALCWGACYIDSVGYPVTDKETVTPLWNALCGMLKGKTEAYLLGMLLTAGGAFMLHRASYSMVLIRENTRLTLLFYVLLISTNLSFLPIKPTTFGVFFLILALYELFSSYHDSEARSKAFNVGLLLGAGSLLWIQLLWFLPVFWIGMYIFLSLGWRTFFATLVGVIAVYWLLLGWCFFEGDFAPFTDTFPEMIRVSPPALSDVSTETLIEMGVGTLLTIASVVKIVFHGIYNRRRMRLFLEFTTILAAWACALCFLFNQVAEEFLMTAYVPVSILIGHFFTNVRSRFLTWLFYATVTLFFTLLFLRLWNFL